MIFWGNLLATIQFRPQKSVLVALAPDTKICRRLLAKIPILQGVSVSSNAFRVKFLGTKKSLVYTATYFNGLRTVKWCFLFLWLLPWIARTEEDLFFGSEDPMFAHHVNVITGHLHLQILDKKFLERRRCTLKENSHGPIRSPQNFE